MFMLLIYFFKIKREVVGVCYIFLFGLTVFYYDSLLGLIFEGNKIKILILNEFL